MDRYSDKGNVPDKENVNMCPLYVPHIEGYRKLRLVMSLWHLYMHPYSPHKQYKHYKYDVLVMSCIMYAYTHHGKYANIYHELVRKKKKKKEKKTEKTEKTEKLHSSGIPDN